MQVQMAQPLLSDLCSICHSETPKYRCPRCKTHTCSLPCYKRHQQRAACSGKRDPAAYVKKNELATPTGVDRDYNYLKGVERTIDDANRSTFQRGVGVEKHSEKRAAAFRDSRSILGEYLQSNSITVQQAPIGMSRQKTNQTRSTKSGKIQWTVEWVDVEDRREVRDCAESSTLSDLFGILQDERAKAERRELEEQRRVNAKRRKGAKRKREQDLETSQRRLDESAIQMDTEFLQNVKSDDASAVGAEETNESTEVSSDPVQIVTEVVNFHDSTDQSAGQQTAHPDAQTQARSSTKDYFYLLKPTTAIASRVLIPLNSTATLTDSLRNQTVLEYPTIYVLTSAPDELGAGFMIEKEYIEEMAKTRTIQPGAPSKASSASSHQPGAQEKKSNDASIDAKSILNMLKRDVAL